MVLINSVRFYRPFWLCMRVLAPSFFKESTPFVRAYEVVLHVLVTVWFPLHLLLHLLLHPSPADLFKNLTMSLTCVACSLKHVAQLYRLPEIVEIESLIERLDQCIEADQELRYYQDHMICQARRFTRCLYISFVIVYIAFFAAAFALIFDENGELIYPAYFPFDWERNPYLYGVAYGYQFISIMVEGIQGLANDTYSPLTLCLLGGHLHLWSIRMARLGFQEDGMEEQSPLDQHERLLKYIEQHKLLMRLHYLTSQAISAVQLVQLGGCGATLCIIVSYLLFFVGDFISLVYYLVFFGTVCVQLFPSCYFASVVAEEVQRLPYAIFSSRWYNRSRSYRGDLLIFTQFTLGATNRVMRAGGIIELNLNAFFATLKMAYSLFAVVVRMKGR
ncbi:hypothetical protein KR038_007788 [Drosophila bunnanda]|nr:hypothetical protein KR038_007788 [Drosophila bunnanda]